MRIVTIAWLPASRPKATPWLRVFTNWMPGMKRTCSPGTIEPRTRCLVSWSRASTSASTGAERTAALERTARTGSAVDDALGVHRKTSGGLSRPFRGVRRHPRCSTCHQHACARVRRLPSTARPPQSHHLFSYEPLDDDRVEDPEREDR